MTNYDLLKEHSELLDRLAQAEAREDSESAKTITGELETWLVNHAVSHDTAREENRE
jgi:hypothetical protein